MLCKKMGIRRTRDLVSVEPEYDMNHKTVILQLDKAKRVNVKIGYQSYLLPQRQYDELAGNEIDWDE